MIIIIKKIYIIKIEVQRNKDKYPDKLFYTVAFLGHILLRDL